MTEVVVEPRRLGVSGVAGAAFMIAWLILGVGLAVSWFASGSLVGLAGLAFAAFPAFVLAQALNAYWQPRLLVRVSDDGIACSRGLFAWSSIRSAIVEVQPDSQGGQADEAICVTLGSEANLTRLRGYYQPWAQRRCELRADQLKVPVFVGQQGMSLVQLAAHGCDVTYSARYQRTGRRSWQLRLPDGSWTPLQGIEDSGPLEVVADRWLQRHGWTRAAPWIQVLHRSDFGQALLVPADDPQG